MGIEASAESPYGTEALMVSKLLGPAYQTVKLVADNMPALLLLSTSTDEIVEAVEAFPAIAAAGEAAVAAAAAAEASATGLSGMVTTAGNSATAAAVSAAAALLAETNAETAADAAAASALLATNIAGANFLPLSGDATVAGNIVFSGSLAVPSLAYSPAWNGSALAATRNDVYDKIETLVPSSLLGAVSGIAQLGADQKLLASQLPDAIVGALKYQGTWNATTNTPAIPAAAAGNKGQYYVVATAGTTAIDGQNDWAIGDWIISSGVAWSKVDNSDKVSSVNGMAGAVVLDKDDIGLGNADNTSDANKPVSTATQAALDAKAPLVPREQTAAANSITPTFLDDLVTRTVTGAVAINAPTGTAVDGHGILIRLVDNGTARAIAWDNIFRVIGGVVLPVTTVVNKTVYVGAVYNQDAAKWDVLYVGQEG